MAHPKDDRGAARPATAADVARRAGVSRTAVSYVLNERGARNPHVSEAARVKILQAARDLDYSIDTAAQALSRGYSEEICVIMEDMGGFFGLDLLSSLQQHARQHGYTTTVHFNGQSQPDWRQNFQRMLDRRPLALFAASWCLTAEDVVRAREKGVRYVICLTFGPQALADTYPIMFPCYASGYLAAQHLLERGHRRLAIGQPEDLRLAEAFAQGRQGMQAAIDASPGSTLEILPLPGSAAGAQQMVADYFARPAYPSGVAAFSDNDAVLLLGALLRRGLRVPQDVALVGASDLSIGGLLYPALTTIRPDTLDIGQRAIELIAHLHAGQPLPDAIARPLAPQLVVREST